jgi:hypothetical protein
MRTEAERERAEVQLETQRMFAEESTRALRDRLDAESSAGPASLERLFVNEALPHLAETMASSLQGARFHVLQGGGDGTGVSPLHFAFREVMDFLGSRAGSNGNGHAHREE